MQTRSDIATVTMKLDMIQNDVAKTDTHAIDIAGERPRVLLRFCTDKVLNFEPATQAFYGAGKFQLQPLAHQFHETTIAARNAEFKGFYSQQPNEGKPARFVAPTEAAVGDCVNRGYFSEATF